MELWIIILIICAVILLTLVAMKLRFVNMLPGVFTAFRGRGESSFKTYEIGSGDTIVLIPGLGNGHESYNWNLSTEEQREKTKLPTSDSLQKAISDLGYHVISFDPPGYGENAVYPVPADAIEYCNLIHGLSDNIKLVIGHSIGGRIAQLYGEMYDAKYIMLDPTPDYILDNIKYTKHLENPNETKYLRTYEFLEMVRSSREKIKALPWRPELIVYSIDSDDTPERAKEKEEYFYNVECTNEPKCKKIKLLDATHWVHVSHPEVLIDYLKSNRW